MPNWPGDAAVFPFCMPIIKQFEGFRAKPYKDSAGIPTIGYGTIQYPDGKAVTMMTDFRDKPCESQVPPPAPRGKFALSEKGNGGGLLLPGAPRAALA